MGQPTAAQQKTVFARPPQPEAKVETELQQHHYSFPGLKGRIKVNMDGSKKEIPVEKAKPLPAINTDLTTTSVSDGPTTDELMQQSTFQDENSGRISQYRNRKFVNRFSEGIIEEPKPVKSTSKYYSDGKLISGTTRQRKLWRKSTLNDENQLDDMLSGKISKQDITDDERTSARYLCTYSIVHKCMSKLCNSSFLQYICMHIKLKKSRRCDLLID